MSLRVQTTKPSVTSRAASGSSSSEVLASSWATGRRNHEVAIRAAWSLPIFRRTALPVAMHSVYGVPGG